MADSLFIGDLTRPKVETTISFEHFKYDLIVPESINISSLHSERLKEFQAKTGLRDFQTNIFQSAEYFRPDLDEAIRNASEVITIQGGWCSDKRVLEKIAVDILKKDPKAIIFLLDHPGQAGSGFDDSEVITTDPKKRTLEFNLRATKLAKEMLGIDDQHILELNQNKKLIKIVHSREAAAHLFDYEGLQNPNIKYVFLAPVLGHDGFKPELTKKLLPLAIKLARKIYRDAPILNPVADTVRDFLIAYYSGSKHKEVRQIYEDNFRRTDKNVLAEFILNLAQVKFPDLKNLDIDSARHLFMVFTNDSFVNSDQMLKEMKQGLGVEAYMKCTKLFNGDHHGFLEEGSKANKMIVDFVTSSK